MNTDIKLVDIIGNNDITPQSPLIHKADKMSIIQTTQLLTQTLG